MQLSGIEIVDVAKKIETFGVAFYDEAAKRAKSVAVRELFAHLRNEEMKHESAFEKLLATLTARNDDWRGQEEYVAYMSQLAEDLVFPPPAVAREMAAALTSERAVLGRALEFEKESILYFEQMRAAVREEDLPILNGLIAEEREHQQLLTDLLSRTDS